jgi:hypothetical protein
MMYPPIHIQTLLTVLLASIASAQFGTITQDLSTYPAYSQQKECAQSCFSYGGGLCFTDVLGE